MSYLDLDLSLLVPFAHGHTFLALDEELVRSLEQLPRTRDRLENAVKFVWFSQLEDPNALCCRVEQAGRLREGFFRAALVELVAAEDVQKLDRGRRNSSDVLRLNSMPHPLLHFVRELRNHEVHLRQSHLESFEQELLCGHLDRPGEARPLTLTLWRLEGVTAESFLALRNVRGHYSREQVEAMVEWFNAAQGEWGVQEVFFRAVQIYAAALCQRYTEAE